MTENELSAVIVDIAFQIHTKLGPGLLESVYEEIAPLRLSEKTLTIFIT
jgi:GxxExxY protein